MWAHDADPVDLVDGGVHRAVHPVPYHPGFYQRVAHYSVGVGFGSGMFIHDTTLS